MKGGVFVSEYGEYVNININKDEMSADIFLVSPPSEDFYNMPELLEFIDDAGVVFGIKNNILKDIVEHKRYGEYIRFAEGIMPGEPKNGYFEFKFNTNPSKKPKLKPDGSVDYYNLNLIEITEKDELIAEYIPKEDGTEGKNVRGNIVPGKKAHDMPPLRGKGFYVSEDNTKYFAEFAGKIELSLGRLTVSNTHTIEGDVDLSTGNLDLRGDLYIKGNVKSNMVVKASGNITIDGLVEDANIEAGKGILIKGGILGGDKAVIKAIDNVFASFIESAYVESNACIQADSIINSTIVAYNDINVFGKTARIIGGRIKANRYVKTKVIGSKKGVTTIVEVGVPNDCHVDKMRYSDQLEDLQQEQAKVEKLIEKIAETGEEMTEMFISITRRKIELSAEIYRLKALIGELEKRITIGKDAQIIAEKKIFPGAEIFIDGIKYIVSDEFERILFFRKVDKVVSKRYDLEEDERISKNLSVKG